jgi:hypothetical protein
MEVTGINPLPVIHYPHLHPANNPIDFRCT